MTFFERVLFAAGIAVTLLASAGLCAQVYVWRTVCTLPITQMTNVAPREC